MICTNGISLIITQCLVIVHLHFKVLHPYFPEHSTASEGKRQESLMRSCTASFQFKIGVHLHYESLLLCYLNKPTIFRIVKGFAIQLSNQMHITRQRGLGFHRMSYVKATPQSYTNSCLMPYTSSQCDPELKLLSDWSLICPLCV